MCLSSLITSFGGVFWARGGWLFWIETDGLKKMNFGFVLGVGKFFVCVGSTVQVYIFHKDSVPLSIIS